MNGALWNKPIADQLPRLRLRTMAALSFVNSFDNFQYMYVLEPVLDGTELNYIAGSLYDGTIYCALTKLASPSFGYTSTVCPRMTENPKAILGDNPPSDMLVGTRWETDKDTA